MRARARAHAGLTPVASRRSRRCAPKRACRSTASSWSREPSTAPCTRARYFWRDDASSNAHSCRNHSRAGSPAAAGRRARISLSFWQGAGRPLGAADRADRRRQDARGIPAEPGGAERSAAAQQPAARKLVSTGRDMRRDGGPAHALHLAAQGAGGRHRAQPGNADRRDGAADPHRDAHRRHADLEAPAPAPRSAGDSADHAGAGRAAARLGRRAVSVRLAQARHARRAACAGDLETRRSAVARPGAAVSARART